MKSIYIIGAGGFAREVVWLIERINEQEPSWNIEGFIDDNIEIHGKELMSYPVLGGIDYLSDIDKNINCVLAIGSSDVKEKIYSKLSLLNHIEFPNLIDPSVLYSKSVKLGKGNIICAGSILTVDIELKNFVTVNLDCTIGHDVEINDFVTIYPSVNVSGNVIVGKNSELGTGTQIIQGKNIGEFTIVGAGSVVVKDLPNKIVAVGSPAKAIKER